MILCSLVSRTTHFTGCDVAGCARRSVEVTCLLRTRRMADEDEDPTFEEDTEETGGGAEGGHGKRKRLFSKELRCMMYGFGDDQNPYTESVDILEDLVIEFITEMTHKAMSIGRQGRVQVEDIVFLIRKNPRKFARVKDLLTMNEELKRARKAFDEANYGS
ncbi:transcription initiation factor TFIID subunit 13 [Rhinatrema bivittatum]|uniref:transcription initiation factor TFIID subunit 13 n=1 Tax=Rhinatrema bivittatum TaxID=194408 RepID=UPI0011286A4F|nr:transcription initiation factor TFIID subunit 13 [Rhinatrema bivittatum]